MKAKITALNKDYLVEFKDEDQFVSFLTQHNDKVNNVEIINEDTLPELQKPVQVAKPSMSDGWKTLEKSAFTQKEKGVEKKGMTLGGKYAEFKYEPDKTLDNAADSKVSEPKNDSPALKGDAPEASSVEEAPKAEKAEAPKAEESKAEPAKKESPKAEAPKAEKAEDKEEKKEEVKESVEDDFDDESYEDEGFQVWVKDNSNYTECVSIEESEEAAIEEAKRIYDESEDKNIVVFVNDSNTGNTIFSTKEEVKEAANPDMSVKEHLKDILDEFSLDSDLCFDIFDCMSPESQQEYLNKNGYEDIGYAYDDNRELAYDLVDFMNSEDLAKCKVMIEKWKAEEDEELEEVFKAAGLEEGWKDKAKGALAGLAMGAAVANANPAVAANKTEIVIDPVQIEQAEQNEGKWTKFNFINGNGDKDTMEIKYVGDGEFVDEYEHSFDKYDLKALQKGEDPYGV